MNNFMAVNLICYVKWKHSLKEKNEEEIDTLNSTVSTKDIEFVV